MTLQGKHLCETCKYDFATCAATRIVFGIDRDPSLRGADADTVLECNAFALLHLTSNPQQHRERAARDAQERVSPPHGAGARAVGGERGEDGRGE